jgi:hypothetical protein
MQIVRRLYLYGMSGITLGVLLVGLNNLFVVVFHAFGLGRGQFGGPSADREQLSLAIALIVVGLLVWTIHWLIVERSVRDGAADGAEERTSAIRAFYLSVVLAVLLVFGVLAGVQLLEAIAHRLLGITNEPDFELLDIDSGAALATVLVVGLAWLYHAVIRRRDLATAPMEGAAAWIPRVYLYGAALLGLILTAISIGSLLDTALDLAVGIQPDFGPPSFAQRAGADAVAGIVGWGVVFAGHWWYATSLMGGDGWRATSERRARLRVAYLLAVIVASAIATVGFGGASLTSLVLALGIDRQALPQSPLRSIVGPLLLLLPWAFAWLVHRRWLDDEARALHDPDRIVAVGRLAAAGVALVGAFAAAGGVGGLLGLLIDLLLGGDRTAGSSWRDELAAFLAVAFIGGGLWLWNWANLQNRRAAAPQEEARSTIRRAYLLIILGASLLAALASLAVLLFQLFNAILAVEPFGNVASLIATALGILLTAAASAAYHGLAERRDRALRRGLAAAPAIPLEAEVPGEAPAAAPAGAASRQLLLSGPSPEALDAAVASIRGALPAEVSLEEAPGDR